MKRFSIILFLGLGLLFMGGCTANAVQNNTSVEPTVAAEVQATEVAAEPIDMETDSCVDCHTDKDKLTETADPEEEDAHGEESEGVG